MPHIFWQHRGVSIAKFLGIGFKTRRHTRQFNNSIYPRITTSLVSVDVRVKYVFEHWTDWRVLTML